MQRRSDRRGRPSQRAVGLVGPVVAGDDGHAEPRRQPTGRGLVAHGPDRVRRVARPSGCRPRRRLPRSRRSRSGTRSPDGARRRRPPGPRRRPPARRAGRRPAARPAPGRRRRCRAARRSGGSAPRSRRGWRRTAVRTAEGRPARPRGARHRRLSGSAARQQRVNRVRRDTPSTANPPGGSFPSAIQRWTVRVEAPSREAAWLGLSSCRSVMARLSRSAAAAQGRPLVELVGTGPRAPYPRLLVSKPQSEQPSMAHRNAPPDPARARTLAIAIRAVEITPRPRARASAAARPQSWHGPSRASRRSAERGPRIRPACTRANSSSDARRRELRVGPHVLAWEAGLDRRSCTQSSGARVLAGSTG